MAPRMHLMLLLLMRFFIIFFITQARRLDIIDFATSIFLSDSSVVR